jgi:hypothetical protein
VQGFACVSIWLDLCVHFCPPHIITNTAVHKEGGGGKKSGYTSDQTVLKRALFTKSWPGSAARSYSSSLKKDVVFLTLIFCLAHFSYLVSDITVLQTRFSPLPIGVHRNKQYPHNRWAPRTWRGGALECLTLPPRRDGRTWGLTTRYFQQHAWHCQSPSQSQPHARNWNIDASTRSHENLDFPGNIHTMTILLRTTV